MVQVAYAAAAGHSQYIALQIRWLIEDFLGASPLHHIQIAWTPGHQTHHNTSRNKRAEKLAKEATERNDALHLNADRSSRNREEAVYGVGRRIGTEMLATQCYRLWTHTLKFQTPHLYPSRSLLVLCSVGGRTGHGFLGEYYASFVPTEPTVPGCLCREPRQAREHILRDCPLFRHTPTYLLASAKHLITSYSTRSWNQRKE
ncbi:hypothetical protein BDR05DRAFT_964559 [Suillus weaverae]|nr:hypothetical protein BDR05DRAFT_964559 [Suillus weaverae]